MEMSLSRREGMLKPLVLYLVATVVSACVVTPLLFSALLSVFPSFPWPFSRVFDRVILGCAVLLFIPFRRAFPIRDVLEYFRGPALAAGLIKGGLGFLLSAATALAVLVVVVDSGSLSWANWPASYYAMRVAQMIPVAVIISIVEESFFRAFVFKRLCDSFPWIVAAAISSAIYAVVHFISPVKNYVYPGLSLFAGFDYLGVVLGHLLLPGVPAGFLGLFLVGMALCAILYYTESLFLCIGLHSGWVMAMKMALYATGEETASRFPAGIGQRYFLVAQPIGWVSILLVLLIVLMCRRFFDFRSPTTAGAGLADPSRA